MLKIQVLGNGLIPRGYGIAPRKDPFPADLVLIGTILNAPGLKVNMLHPDGRYIPITKSNLKRMWESYSNVTSFVKPAEIKPPENNIPSGANNSQSTITDPPTVNQEETPSQHIQTPSTQQKPVDESAKQEENTDNTSKTDNRSNNKSDEKSSKNTVKPVNAPNNRK